MNHHRMFTHGTVYSSREVVNVILPGTGYRGEGNHIYPASRGKALNHVRRMIQKALTEEFPKLVDSFEITAYESPDRGHYSFSVWV